MKQFPQPAVDFECEKSFWGKMTVLQDVISKSIVKDTKNDGGGRSFKYASEADVYPKIVEATTTHEMNVVLAAHLPLDILTSPGHASVKVTGVFREEYEPDMLTVLVIRITDLNTGYYQYFFHTSSIPPEAYKKDGVVQMNKLISYLTRSYRNALTKIFLAAGDPEDDADYGQKGDNEETAKPDNKRAAKPSTSDTIKIAPKTNPINTIKKEIFNELLKQGYPQTEIPQLITGLITLTPEITNTIDTLTETDCQILLKEVTNKPTQPEIK